MTSRHERRFGPFGFVLSLGYIENKSCIYFVALSTPFSISRCWLRSITMGLMMSVCPVFGGSFASFSFGLLMHGGDTPLTSIASEARCSEDLTSFVEFSASGTERPLGNEFSAGIKDVTALTNCARASLILYS